MILGATRVIDVSDSLYFAKTSLKAGAEACLYGEFGVAAGLFACCSGKSHLTIRES